jgi:outer membrane lipoprotein-sorting protein
VAGHGVDTGRQTPVREDALASDAGILVEGLANSRMAKSLNAIQPESGEFTMCDRFICLLAALVLLSHPLAAQQTNRKDGRALSVLAEALAAMLAPGAVIQDAVVQASIELPDGTTGSLVLESKGSGSIRRELMTPSGQTSYVVSQGRGYYVVDGEKRELPLWTTAFEGPQHIPVLSRASQFGRDEIKLIYVGLEDVAGRPTHHVRLSVVPDETGSLAAQALDLMSELHVFVDQATRLITKTQGFIFSPETLSNRTQVDTLYSDYRRVGGALVPYRITASIMGRKLSDVTVTNVSFNTGLLDSRFE